MHTVASLSVMHTTMDSELGKAMVVFSFPLTLKARALYIRYSTLYTNITTHFHHGHRAGVVNGVDLKSTGLSPRRFESFRCRCFCLWDVLLVN